MVLILMLLAALGLSAPAQPRPVVADCSTRSLASFPDLRDDPGSVHVGPLVLDGGAHTAKATIRQYGGDKIPVLVENGHVVTVTVSPRSTARAALGYGPLPEGEVRLRDAHRSVTFRACASGSGSSMGDVPVTFWSGFIVAESFGCVELDVQVRGERGRRRALLEMGGRC